MTNVKDFINHIDIQRISGIRSILGIDISDNHVHVVELKRRGSILNKFSGRFEVMKHFQETLPGDLSATERGVRLKDLIAKHGASARYAVGAISSLGVKTVTTPIPTTIARIDEWIKDNHEKLLRVHLSIDLMAFSYEILAQDESMRTLEISFVKKSEIEDYRKLFKAAGIELFALAAGARDAVNALVVSTAKLGDKRFLHFDDQFCTITSFSNGKRIKQEQVSTESRPEFTDDTLGADSGSIILAGLVPEGFKNRDYETLKPLNLPTNHTLAVGLAIKGFLSEISPVNFLTHFERDRLSDRLHKSLTARAVLALGIVVILLLGMEVMAKTLLQSRIEALDEMMASGGADIAAVQALDKKVKTFERNLAGNESVLRRSTFARILHDVASSAPDSMWLYKLQIKENEGHNQEVFIYGFARSDESISRYLSQLEVIARPIGVELLHSGSGHGADDIVQVKSTLAQMVTFEIRAVFSGN
jgi:Tfp pilus assembly protein PilN